MEGQLPVSIDCEGLNCLCGIQLSKNITGGNGGGKAKTIITCTTKNEANFNKVILWTLVVYLRIFSCFDYFLDL